MTVPGLLRPGHEKLQHFLDRPDQVAIDADHVGVRRQREFFALLRRDRAALQDDAAIARQIDRLRGFLLAFPHQLDAELQSHASFTPAR